MTKWSIEPYPSTGTPYTVYAVLYYKYYPELARTCLVLDLAVYDYCIQTDSLAWLCMKERKMLAVEYWCELPGRPE